MGDSEGIYLILYRDTNGSEWLTAYDHYMESEARMEHFVCSGNVLVEVKPNTPVLFDAFKAKYDKVRARLDKQRESRPLLFTSGKDLVERARDGHDIEAVVRELSHRPPDYLSVALGVMRDNDRRVAQAELHRIIRELRKETDD